MNLKKQQQPNKILQQNKIIIHVLWTERRSTRRRTALYGRRYMDGVYDALFVTASRVFEVLSHISSCRDQRSVTSIFTQCHWRDSANGSCDGQGDRTGPAFDETNRQTVVKSEPGASYMYTRKNGLRKMVEDPKSSGKVCGPCVVLGALFWYWHRQPCL